MRALITGAGGFIGRHVVEALLARGHEVHAATRTRPAPGGAATHHVAELTRADEVERLLNEVAPEVVVHLAWYAEPGRYLMAASANAASLAATANLLAGLSAAGCQRVVLGGTGLECWDDSDRIEHIPYVAAKRAAHTMAMTLQDEGVKACCAHIHWLYGLGEDQRRAVPAVAASLLDGKRTAVGASDRKRDFLHVSDVGSALATIAASDLTGRVDVSSGRPVTFRAVFEQVAAAVGRPELLDVGGRAEGPHDPPEFDADAVPLESLGWKPAVELADGLAEVVASLRAERDPSSNRRERQLSGDQKGLSR